MKKKTAWKILGIVLVVSIGTISYRKLVLDRTSSLDQATETTVSSDYHQLAEEVQAIQLDVPLENQFDELALGNGCEVTSLSMLLNYYDYGTDKNSLAELLDYVPLYVDDYYHGNPKDGFVGNIYGGDEAMGVDVEPIAKVAAQIVDDSDYEVVSGRDKSFTEIIDVLTTGAPIWIIATLDLEVPTADDFVTWDTTSGEISVTPLIHSVVITGIDGDTVYVNDPYGYKDREVSIEDLAAIYESMGQQYLYLQETSA